MSGRNWAGNVVFRAARVHRPSSVAQLRDIVAGTDRIRALGTGHSFNRIADTDDDLVTLADLPPVVSIEDMSVRVSAGTRYGELASALNAHGRALHNLASLPHIGIAGACATATHGSGSGNLATAVSAMEIIGADGQLTTVDRSAPEFNGMVVGLGALGIVTSLTLDLVPSYEISQYVYENMPFAALGPDLFDSGYSVSVFTDWTGPRANQVWVKRLADAPPPPARWHGATIADGPRHPIAGMDPMHCTDQLGRPGPWHERLPHFRLDFTPSAGDELQSEFFIARSDMVPALSALDGIRERIAAVLQISELRSVAADELWLSPAYHRESVAIHFTWVGDVSAVEPVLAAVQQRLDPFAPRPHWGKLFCADPAALAARYKRWPDFHRLGYAHSRSKFHNSFITTLFPPPSP